VGRRTRAQQRQPGGDPPPPSRVSDERSAWERFNAHSPRYRIAAALWVVSIFLIPATFPLHSVAATGAAILLTWLAIHHFRRVDIRERRAADRDAAGDPGGPATSAGTTPR
jgi:hypothetical protein